MKSLTFVFVGATILSTLLGSAEASHLSSKHARMMKKRATSVFDPVAPNAPVLGVGQDPNQNTTPKNVANNSVSASGTAAAGQPTGGNFLSIPVDSILGGLTNSPTNSLSSDSASQSSSSSSSSSFSPSSSSDISLPTSTPASTPTVSQAGPQTQFATVFSTAEAANTPSQSPADVNVSGAASNTGPHIATTTVIILASVAGGIALIAIIWTVIRKWKFRPSNEFEDRLNPINWDPTSGETSMIERERPQHYRANSKGSNRSFHSADAQSNYHNNTGNGGLISDLPNHDFTAGGRTLGAYADLQRGPSPAPSRGPSPYDYGSRGYTGGY